MAHTRLEREVWVTTKNEVGTLTRLTAPLSEAKVNIWGLSAWEEGGNARFRFITDNYEKTVELFRNAGYTADTHEVVVTEIEDRPGTTWNTAQTLSNAGININYMYVTTCEGCPTTRAIFCCSDNNKAISLLG